MPASELVAGDEVVVYPGTPHAFFLDGTTPAAEDAWRRSVELFRGTL